MDTNSDYKSRIKEKLKAVNFSDGIDKEEAITLAQNYLIEKGYDKDINVLRIHEVTDTHYIYGNKFWFISFSAKLKVKIKQFLLWNNLWEAVLVDRQTGVVQYIGGPGTDL